MLISNNRKLYRSFFCVATQSFFAEERKQKIRTCNVCRNRGYFATIEIIMTQLSVISFIL